MVRRNKYYLLILFMAGFFAGILYANFVDVNYVTTTGIFHEFFLSQYASQNIVTEKYLLYLIRRRVVPLVFLAFAGMTKLRKIVTGIGLLWTGFSGGMLAASAVMRMGLSGMVFYIAALFPHVFFYGFAYLIIVVYFMDDLRAHWNTWKTIAVLLAMTAGIIMEVYLNPLVVRWVMRILC